MKQWILRHKTGVVVSATAAVILALVAGVYLNYVLNRPFLTDEGLAELRAQAAQQNESAVILPQPQPLSVQQPNPDRNLYFGDLHVHSRLSFDSYVFGNRLSVEDAYRFAKGQPMDNSIGEKMQLFRPLDFAAITDHAEGFGLHEACALPDRPSAAIELCRRFEQPSIRFFQELRRSGEQRPIQPMPLAAPDVYPRLAQLTWQHIVRMAEKHNEPGQFTTFAAYEYSPPLPDSGKIHRNVIFRNQYVPERAVSAFDADTEIDVWRALAADCRAPCEAISIPHNPNKSWGLAFAGITIDGDLYTEADWQTRRIYEPLVEMFQIKGNSECALGLNTRDEGCRFEQFLPLCPPDAVVGVDTACIHPTSMARDGLKKGLQLLSELGFNPLQFGLIGSTDTHNSNPGDTEEADFRGAAASFAAPAEVRLNAFPSARQTRLLQQNPGGLAAVWAEENTRDALFDAMQRREVYATSGTRIGLRFFGGYGTMEQLLPASNPARLGYRIGVPMGGQLQVQGGAKPAFFVWAARDPLAAPLDRVQIIKAWQQDGAVQEMVIDIACSNGRQADASGQCPPLVSAVGADCQLTGAVGANELKAVWRDASAQAGEQAFYYARVIAMPSCRWSTYDALRLNQSPPAQVPAQVAEMAWSSPIWVGGQAE
ncbi:MAG: DUF3604 domain-containing protein [Gammaproteobacteria bacterium]